MITEKKHSTLSDLIVLLLIFSTDTFVVFSNVSKLPRTVFQAILLCVMLFSAVKTLRVRFDRLIIYLLMVIPVIGCIIVNKDFSGGNIIKIFMLTLGLCITEYLPFDLFSESFYRIMCFLAIFSLFTYAFSPLLIKASSVLPVIINTSNTKVVFLVFSNVTIKSGIPRNAGPFWEPGVFSIYLNLALVLHLKAGNKLNFKDLLIAIAVLTTFSTAGIAVLAVVVFDFTFAQRYKEFHITKKTKSRIKIAVALVMILVIVVLLSNVEFRNIIIGKLNRSDVRFASTKARLNSILINIQIWASRPLFGVGASQLSDIYVNIAKQNGTIDFSNTNGLLMHFSLYGIIEGVVLVYCLIKFAWKVRCNQLSRLMILLVLLMMLFSEPLVTSVLINVIIFYAIPNPQKNQVITRIDLTIPKEGTLYYENN